MMRLHVFNCLVAIVISSAATVLANAIPPSMADMSRPSILHHGRGSMDFVKRDPQLPSLPPSLPTSAIPALPTGSLPALPARKRGFLETFRNVLPDGFRPSVKRSPDGADGAELKENYTDSRITQSLSNVTAPIKVQTRGEDRENNNEDMENLNFALLLSQLAYAFFENGLKKYNEDEFRQAGYADWVRGRYDQIKEHEKAHVEFLQSAVTTSGRDRVLPCDYVFNQENIRAFIDVSEAITTIVASGFIGILHDFQHDEYITIFASITSVESRQASWINSAVRKQNPWNTAFETPLTANQVLTLFSVFFEFDKMPAQNRGLLPRGIRPYPRLNLAQRLLPGEEAEISFPYSRQQEGEHLYAAFLVGFETIFVVVNERLDNGGEHHDGDENGGNGNGNGNGNRNKYYVTIPKDLSARGTVYVSVVRGRENINNVRFDDASIVAGPAIALFPFDAHGKPIGKP